MYITGNELITIPTQKKGKKWVKRSVKLNTSRVQVIKST